MLSGSKAPLLLQRVFCIKSIHDVKLCLPKSSHDDSRKNCKVIPKIENYSAAGRRVFNFPQFLVGIKKWNPSNKNWMRQMTSPRLSN